jgi:nucleotide-binding universal stress UspA family protein
VPRTTAPPHITPRRAFSRGPRRPILLATLAGRVDPSAERVAIESALEANRRLLLVNAVHQAQGPAAHALGGVPESVRATAQRAMSLGVQTELLRPISPRPAQTIVRLANEHQAALIVLGRPRGLLGRWRFRRVARAIHRGTTCLVWLAGS